MAIVQYMGQHPYSMAIAYEQSLAELEPTYTWARLADVSHFAAVLSRCADTPLIATGSGGSLSVAQLIADAHEAFTGQLARAVSPLELATLPAQRSLSMVLVSARGTNPDAVGGARLIAGSEPRVGLILTLNERSPLVRLTRRYSMLDLVQFDGPARHDGFLAVNSLVALAVLSLRAYANAFGTDVGLPERLSTLLPSFAGLDARIARLGSPETVIVAYAPGLRAAALDLESKFTESALASVQVSDLRNLAHGRHNWLDKRAKTTCLIVLSDRAHASLARRTLALLPAAIRRVSLEFAGERLAANLAALTAAQFVFGSFARARGVNPNRPRIKRFGRELYHLRAFPSAVGRPNPLLAAVERKAGRPVAELRARGEFAFWSDHLARVTDLLASARFSALAIDYDGTICDEHDRVTGVRPAMAAELARLARAGLVIAIATGRGRSVHIDLRAKFPRAIWPRVLIGYYNGGQIRRLDEGEPTRDGPDGELANALRALSEDAVLQRLAISTGRSCQITLEPRRVVDLAPIWFRAQEIVARVVPGLDVLQSSHSVEVLGRGVSKARLLDALAEQGLPTADVVCVGDRGRWPGNDHAFLTSTYSLSVDQVSAEPTSCWNLAPVGQRGLTVTALYLHALVARRSTAHMTPWWRRRA